MHIDEHKMVIDDVPDYADQYKIKKSNIPRLKPAIKLGREV